MKYRFAFVVTGEMEAPSEEAARLETMRGVSLTGKLLAHRPDIALQVAPAVEAAAGNGTQPSPHLDSAACPGCRMQH